MLAASAIRRAIRPHMARFDNFFSRGWLNRTSWLRQDVDFLTRSCQSDQARFVVLDGVCNPLVKAQNSTPLKQVIKDKLEGELVLATLTWKDVASYFPSSESEPLFVTEPTVAHGKKPLLVFLGIDERGLESDATVDESNDQAAKTQKSLPQQKDTGYTPDGLPYFVIDTSRHADLAEKAKSMHGGEDSAMFMDLRAEVLSLDFESTGVVSEARALVDWNKRNQFCAGCGRETGSVWSGWKRACLPPQPSADGDGKPPCVSKKGVHNFAYPRTDPVVIMAVQSHDKKKLLLGRQKVWPKGFFSCLAGFIEPGESIEESVKREVWEEAGVRVDSVQYHSSQPWPFPGSLMLGCLATAAPETEIRTDLDNELESADFYAYETVKLALNKASQTGLSRAEVAQIQKASDEAEQLHKVAPDASQEAIEAAKNLRIPPKSAIAHTLIRAWVEQAEAEGRANL